MTTIDSAPDATAVASEQSTIGRLLATDVDWLTSTDHKKIGRMFMGAGLLGLLATVVVNMIVAHRTRRWRVDRLRRRFVAAVAEQPACRPRLRRRTAPHRRPLDRRDAAPAGRPIAGLPSPRSGQACTLWLGGFILSIIAMVDNGGFGGGNSDMVDLFLASHGLMALGFTGVGVSLVTSVLTTRAPGMTMRRVPFFAFSTLVYGIGLVLVMPVLFGVMIYLFVDHRSGAREAFGGNEGIGTWAGWIFTQPTTFLFAIPAIGVFADLVPTTFRKRTPMRGVVFAGISASSGCPHSPPPPSSSASTCRGAARSCTSPTARTSAPSSATCCPGRSSTSCRSSAPVCSS